MTPIQRSVSQSEVFISAAGVAACVNVDHPVFHLLDKFIDLTSQSASSVAVVEVPQVERLAVPIHK